MSNHIKKKDFLGRDGQSQKARFPETLDPLYAKIDERGLQDLLSFSSEYAKLLYYFDHFSNETNGDWRPFFDQATFQTLLREEEKGNVEPHMALFLAFLDLFKHAQNHINSLTKRHLDFYYKEVLRLEKKVSVPDKVHMLFELKKNIENQLIKAGTLLKAGKDNTGRELFYALTEDIIVNKAKVESLKSLFVDKKNNYSIHFAPVANSSDGLGGELNENAPEWQAFGKNSLPRAELGFAIASPMLLLNEGERTIRVYLTVKVTKPNFNTSSIQGNIFSVYLSGQQGWIGPKNAFTEIKKLSESDDYELNLIVNLDSEEEGVVNYDPKIHGGTFETTSPLMQIMPKKGIFHQLKDLLLKYVRIEVSVNDITGLTLENDLGTLNPKKPFMPFGPNPVAGSNFYIGYDEALSKDIDKFTLKIRWQDVPDQNLATYYKAYKSLKNVTSNEYFKANLYHKDKSWDNVVLFDKYNAKAAVEIPKQKNDLKGVSISPFYTGIFKIQQMKNSWAAFIMNKIKMTKQTGLAPSYTFPVKPEEFAPKKGFLQLQLQTSFLHKEYRELLTTNVVTYGGTGDLTLPKEPYTPVMQSISLNYTAKTSNMDLTSKSEDVFLGNEIEFFHITAFGQRQEHTFLKSQLTFVKDTRVFLLPQYNNEGEFYIGVAGIEPLQNACILFQVAEASANPDRKKVPVKWSILSDNHWKSLNEEYLLSDTTNGLLTSGIIKFGIPKQATNSNTLMPAGYYWIKAGIESFTDAVCQMIEVRTNAALAQFKDNNNDPEHLRNPLEAEKIKKLAEQIATIKGVTQPYSSFGGKMAEDDKSFYTRVSERLRHKNRAVSVWDYERIVLENFPSLYKVKCLSHACPFSDSAPGHVTLIVIPDLKYRNSYNPFKPKVDLDTLSKIGEFLSDYIGFFVKLHVINPLYEEVKVDFKVSFMQGFEPAYYRGVLSRDIQKFLSPWAFEEKTDISFGGQIHKSVILNYIEKLSYVDYITQFKMYHEIKNIDIDVAAATNSRAILVSAKDHKIRII